MPRCVTWASGAWGKISSLAPGHGPGLAPKAPDFHTLPRDTLPRDLSIGAWGGMGRIVQGGVGHHGLHSVVVPFFTRPTGGGQPAGTPAMHMAANGRDSEVGTKSALLR